MSLHFFITKRTLNMYTVYCIRIRIMRMLPQSFTMLQSNCRYRKYRWVSFLCIKQFLHVENRIKHSALTINCIAHLTQEGAKVGLQNGRGGGGLSIWQGPSEVPRELFSSAGTNTIFDIMYIYIYTGALDLYGRIVNHFYFYFWGLFILHSVVPYCEDISPFSSSQFLQSKLQKLQKSPGPEF